MNFLRKSVKVRLATSLGVCIALLVVVGALGIFSANSTQKGLERTYKQNVIALRALANIRSTLLNDNINIISVQRERDLNEAAQTQRDVAASNKQVDKSWERYSATVTDATERTLADGFHRDMLNLRDEVGQALTLMVAGNFDQARTMSMTTLGDDYTKTLDQLSAIIDNNVDQAKQSYNDNAARYQQMLALVAGVIVAAMIVAILLTVWLVRGIMRPLLKARHFADALAHGQIGTHIEIPCKDEFGDLLRSLKAMESKVGSVVQAVRSNAESVTHAASEIADGNDDLNRRTQEQAASLEETAASMEEITTTVRQNADNATQADTLVQGVSRQAQEGGDAIQQTMSAMNEISASSREIVGIVGLIDEIAFQTNLLALNAAVEAARAGEQGRGFAVVASEVRSLASRSASAAKEIKTLVEKSAAKVETGTALVDRSGKTLLEIVDNIKRVTDLVGEIAVASKEQATGIDQVNVAVSQMDAVTQQNASLVEQSSAASRSLQSQAKALLHEVSFFKVVDANEEGVAPPFKASAAQPAAAPRDASAQTKAPAPAVRQAATDSPSRPVTRTPAKRAVVSDDDWTEF